MTVRDLIALLGKMDQALPVVVRDWDFENDKWDEDSVGTVKILDATDEFPVRPERVVVDA